MVQWSLAPKWPILVHFCGMDHQKSNFLLILAPFLSEAVEDSRCYFFENWFMKLKIYYLLKPLGTITQQNYWFFYPSELIHFAIFTMRHPVWGTSFCFDSSKNRIPTYNIRQVCNICFSNWKDFHASSDLRSTQSERNGFWLLVCKYLTYRHLTTSTVCVKYPSYGICTTYLQTPW